MTAAAHEIQGWMGRASLGWLAKEAGRRDLIVEVGCWHGRSTKALASACPGTVYAVDTWAGVPDDPEQHGRLYMDAEGAWDAFRANLADELAAGKVVPVQLPSLEAAAEFQAIGRVPDFVFLDADHRYEAVRADILAWRGVMKRGGVLAGHDYASSWPGVRQAVDELLPHAHTGPQALWWIELGGSRR